MNPPIRHTAFLHFLRANLVEVLTGLLVLHLAYTALLPFDFASAVAEQEAEGKWFGLQIAAPNTPDVASNVALYIPLGVLLRATLIRRRVGRMVSIVSTVLLAAGLSWVTEYSQHYSPSRICSAADFLCNTLGATCGTFVCSVFLWFARGAAGRYRTELYECPTSVLAQLVAVGVLVLAVVPLDVTFTVNRAVAALGRAHVVPLRKLANIADRARAAEEAGAYCAALRDWWMLCFEYIVQAAVCALLAVLTVHYLRRYCGSLPRAARRWALLACVMLAIATGAGQLFVLSRGFDTTYILMGIIGAWVGGHLYGPLMRRWSADETASTEAVPASRKRLLSMVLVGIAVFVVLRETAPFRVVATTDSIVRQAASADWLPMNTYQQARLSTAADDVIWKLLWFASLGAIIALWQAAPPRVRVPLKPWAIGMVVAACIAVLELGQLLLPSRIPALTDVLLAFIGASAGVHAYRLALAYYADVRANPLSRNPARIRFDVELGPPEAGTPEVVPPQASAGEHSSR